MLQIAHKTGPAPKEMRSQYLRALPHAQEFYLESKIQGADHFEITLDKKTVGYALVKEATVLEIYIASKHKHFANQAFPLVAEKSKAKAALCKSFDLPFAEACKSLNWQPEPCAFLFRKIIDNSLKLPFTVRPVPAKESDIEVVLSCHDGFFDSVDEIKTYFEKDSQIFIYTIDETPVGCGVTKRITPYRTDWDIGMVVTPSYRQKGYGTEIVNHLKHFSLRVGRNPVAGCSIDNLASKRTLEKAGFASEHKLLKFSAT